MPGASKHCGCSALPIPPARRIWSAAPRDGQWEQNAQVPAVVVLSPRLPSWALWLQQQALCYCCGKAEFCFCYQEASGCPWPYCGSPRVVRLKLESGQGRWGRTMQPRRRERRVFLFGDGDLTALLSRSGQTLGHRSICSLNPNLLSSSGSNGGEVLHWIMYQLYALTGDELGCEWLGSFVKKIA